MKFRALVHKEFRECLPWVTLAAVVFLLLASFDILVKSRATAWIFYSSRLFARTPIQDIGQILLWTATPLGAVLAIRQFWLPEFTATWPFLLHRPCGRMTILAAKMTVAGFALLLSLGIGWSAIYAYSRYALPLPPTLRVFAEGWLFIALGGVVYLGTALVALENSRWYTTRVFGLFWALATIILVMLQWQILTAALVVVANAMLLLFQVIATFAGKEF